MKKKNTNQKFGNSAGLSFLSLQTRSAEQTVVWAYLNDLEIDQKRQEKKKETKKSGAD